MTAAKKAPAKRAPAKKAAAKTAAAAAPAAEEPAAAAPQAAPANPAGPLAAFYPKDAELYLFTTDDGAVIPFPKFATLPPPPRAFYWQLYQLEPIFQGFEWMRYAGVPTEVQAVAVRLPETQYQALFDGWFDDAQLTAGE